MVPLKLVYYSLAHCFLSYCICVWGGAAKYLLQPLVVLQKRMLRVITGSHYNDHTAPLFKEQRMLNLSSIYKLSLAKIFHKIHSKKINQPCNLVNLNQLHCHNTRLSKAKNYHTTFSKTKLGQNTYLTAGLKVWRSIPEPIKSLPDPCFKIQLKNMFIEQQ